MLIKINTIREKLPKRMPGTKLRGGWVDSCICCRKTCRSRKSTGNNKIINTRGIICRTVGAPTTTGGESKVEGKDTRCARRVRVRLAVKSRFQTHMRRGEMRPSKSFWLMESHT